jgi:hypothetical protein
VNLPGTKHLAPGGFLGRSVRLTGGPLETFGDGSVTVRYSGAGGAWTHLVATVSVLGTKTPITEGAAQLKKPSGVLKIPLMDESVLVPRGKKVVVTLGAGSKDGVYQAPVGSKATIRIGRITLKLSLLQHAVSK